MDNRKHMRTEKKTAVKNSYARLLATGIFEHIQVAWLAYLLFFFFRINKFLQGRRMDFIIKHIYCNYSCA